jgi:hypothetical protein
MDSPSEALLVFVHLRKTAGTTVAYVMRRQFGRGQTIDLDAPSVEAANQAWNAMAPARRDRIKCVRGHLPFAPQLFAPRAITCFTILRDPVERVVSEYYFNLHNPTIRYHAALVRERITLDQFASSERFAEVQNVQTRMLAGAKAGLSPVDLVNFSIANLRERIAMVGISERLDETLLLCRAILGWRHLIYRRVNVNRRRPALAAIAPATLEAIERANSLDRELYRYACARFEELLQQHNITNSDVIALRRASQVYGAVRRMAGLPRELWIELRVAAARRRIASSADGADLVGDRGADAPRQIK